MRMQSGSASTREALEMSRETGQSAAVCLYYSQFPRQDIVHLAGRRCFEVASLPDTTPEQRKKLLSFIVVGALIFSFLYALTVCQKLEGDALTSSLRRLVRDWASTSS